MKTKRGHHKTKRRTKPRNSEMKEGGKKIKFIESNRMKLYFSHPDLENKIPIKDN